MRDHARAIFEAAVAAADPYEAVKNFIHREGETLRVGPEETTLCRVDLQAVGRLVVVGAGKASAPMAQAVESALGERIDEGLIIVKHGHGAPLERVRLMEASHPIPDASGLEGAEAVGEILDSMKADGLVVSCLSGGGSALMPSPAEGLSLEDKKTLTRLLLESGATIEETNALRKHCSRSKGGQLARRAYPATVLNLIISDVIGDRLDTIASGPFAPDETTFAYCWDILKRYELTERIPPSIVIHLKKGLDGEVPETPKAPEPCFARVQNMVVANNRKALEAARRKASSLGYSTCLLTDSLQGESREVAKVLAAVAREVLQSGSPVGPPACLLAGGETTVTVRGPGVGGRCQELALAGALALRGLEPVVMLAAGTDGTDGPTDAAGAFADGSTLERAALLQLDSHEHLQANDSYSFFKALGDLITTGPTLSNVMDVICILVGRPSPSEEA